MRCKSCRCVLQNLLKLCNLAIRCVAVRCSVGCSVLQCVAAWGDEVQELQIRLAKFTEAVHFNNQVCCSVSCRVLQCLAVCALLCVSRNLLSSHIPAIRFSRVCCRPRRLTLQRTATYCNTLQRTATHCNTSGVGAKSRADLIAPYAARTIEGARNSCRCS